MADKLGCARKVRKRVKELHEFNPMLGFRDADWVGCSGDFPDAGGAVFEAARSAELESKSKPENQIPLVGLRKSCLQVKRCIGRRADVMAERK